MCHTVCIVYIVFYWNTYWSCTEHYFRFRGSNVSVYWIERRSFVLLVSWAAIAWLKRRRQRAITSTVCAAVWANRELLRYFVHLRSMAKLGATFTSFFARITSGWIVEPTGHRNIPWPTRWELCAITGLFRTLLCPKTWRCVFVERSTPKPVACIFRRRCSH